MYAAMFFITGVSTPFLPVWLASRGLSVAEIGALTILPQLLRIMLAPAVGFAADRRRAHRAMTIWLAALGVVAWLLLSQAAGFAVALIAMALIALSNTLSPLVESIAMAGVRANGHDYGRMRLWGSAGYVAANLGAGWLASHYGNAPLAWLLVAGASATLGASFLLQQPALAAAPAIAVRRLTWTDAQALLQVPSMLPFLLAAAMLQGAHGMYYSYGTLHWQTLGLDNSWYGALWAIGLITEISLFWWSKPAVQWLGAAGLLICGAVVSVLRWGIMAFDPPLTVLWPLQFLHGITFGTSHLGAMHVLARIAPPDRGATAQALYSLASTLGIVCATAFSAWAYPYVGGLAYLAMAAMALVGLAAATTVWRRQPTD